MPSYILWVIHLPAYVASLHRLHAPGSSPFTVPLYPADLHQLQMWRLPLDVYAASMLVAAVIFQRSDAAVQYLPRALPTQDEKSGRAPSPMQAASPGSRDEAARDQALGSA